jgi:hypothetical protein
MVLARGEMRKAGKRIDGRGNHAKHSVMDHGDCYPDYAEILKITHCFVEREKYKTFEVLKY